MPEDIVQKPDKIYWKDMISEKTRQSDPQLYALAHRFKQEFKELFAKYNMTDKNGAIDTPNAYLTKQMIEEIKPELKGRFNTSWQTYKGTQRFVGGDQAQLAVQINLGDDKDLSDYLDPETIRIANEILRKSKRNHQDHLSIAGKTLGWFKCDLIKDAEGNPQFILVDEIQSDFQKDLMGIRKYIDYVKFTEEETADPETISRHKELLKQKNSFVNRIYDMQYDDPSIKQDKGNLTEDEFKAKHPEFVALNEEYAAWRKSIGTEWPIPNIPQKEESGFYNKHKDSFPDYTDQQIRDTVSKIEKAIKQWHYDGLSTVIDVAQRGGYKEVAIHTLESKGGRGRPVSYDEYGQPSRFQQIPTMGNDDGGNYVETLYGNLAKDFGFQNETRIINGKPVPLMVREAKKKLTAQSVDTDQIIKLRKLSMRAN